MAILVQYANGVPGVKFSLDKTEITIGRDLTNDISIDDEFVSKRHAVIQLIQDEVTSKVTCILIDNNSTNHTYVNSIKISAHQLDENDKVFIGQNEFRFSSESVSPVELQNTHNGFVTDAPGLMHENAVQASLPTTPFVEIAPEISGLAEMLFEGYEMPETKHQLGKIVPSLADVKISNKSENDVNKRFSRRLSLI